MNGKTFRPLMENIDKFTGPGMVKSDSDLVAKCIFFTHEFMYTKNPDFDNKTLWDVCQEKYGCEKADMILGFLKKYSDFNKKK